MDDADATDRSMEMINKAHLSNSHRYVPTAIANGECLFCEAPLKPLQRWCDSDCRDDWEHDHAT